MRIHTRLTRDDVTKAAKVAGVDLVKFTDHGSRSHDRAFDVILTGSSPHACHWQRSGDYQAATWDEWGIFLGWLFAQDPDAKATYYRNAGDFHWQTGGRFHSLALENQHRRHKWEYDMPGAWWCECGAVRRSA